MCCASPAGLTTGIVMTSLLMLAALLGVGMAATLGVGTGACRGVTGNAWVADRSDCAKFYLCVEGKAHAFNCGVNVWDQGTKTCVEKGSRFDSCRYRLCPRLPGHHHHPHLSLMSQL